MAIAKLHVGKAAETERYVRGPRVAHSVVLYFLPLVDMLTGFQNALRRRRLKKLAQAVDGFIAGQSPPFGQNSPRCGKSAPGLEDSLKRTLQEGALSWFGGIKIRC
jgi:hypothetical protein